MSITETFALELDDGISGPAGTAAASLEDLRGRITAGQARLRELQAAMGRLKGGTSTNVAAFRQLRDEIAGQKASLAGMESSYVSLGGTFGATTQRQATLLESLRQMPGPLGSVAGRVSTLQGLFGSSAGRMALFAGGALALVATLAAVAVAAVAAAVAIARYTADLIRFGIASADARRSEALHLEGLVLTRRSLHATAGSASELMSAIDRVSGVAAISRGEVTRYAETLYRSGLRGHNLRTALEGVAISAAVGGDEVARRFAGMAVGASRTGRSIDALADRVRARLGGVNARMNSSLGRISERLRDGFAAIFGGPRVAAAIEAFQTRLGEIAGMFTQTSATGRALRAIVEALFPDMLDGATDAGGAIRRMFQYAVLGAQRATIAFLTVRNTLRAFGRSTAGLDALRGALVLVHVPLSALMVNVRIVLAIVEALGQGFAQLAAQTVLAGLAFLTIVGRISTFFESLDLRTLGSNMLDGLVAGLRAGAGAVVDTVRGIAGSAVRTFRSVLGIASPSRVFRGFGANISLGVAEGVRAAAPSADVAVADLVEVPSVPVPAAGARPGASGAPSLSVSIGDIHVHSAAPDARGIVEDLRAQVSELFEQLAAELGGAVRT